MSLCVFLCPGDCKKREEREEENGSDSEPVAAPQQRARAWLPLSLAVLFDGDTVARPIQRPQRGKRFDREVLMMELLAAEYSGEEPDDGALEGSGDDYE